MRFSKRLVIAVFILSLFFYAAQALVWVHATAHARSETDKQITEQTHPPSAIPSIVASALLVLAAALASIPAKTRP
ncbi:MAG TPA: hypothetical protein VMU53_03410 [Candidatus Sulfotelmatobacter sp.]|nr:hypothetical protein [Candidatus Sulfotelmatobacter sp.]